MKNKKEKILHIKRESDTWICVCGNTPFDDGFNACDKDGKVMEPKIKSGWKDHYVCNECGRYFSHSDLKVIGKVEPPSQNAKGIDELKEQLTDFETDIMVSIGVELLRINRPVQISELNIIPFIEEVQPYIEAIHLDKDFIPVLDTSFQDIEEKFLDQCLSDNETSHWDLLCLLDMLYTIK